MTILEIPLPIAIECRSHSLHASEYSGSPHAGADAHSNHAVLKVFTMYRRLQRRVSSGFSGNCRCVRKAYVDDAIGDDIPGNFKVVLLYGFEIAPGANSVFKPLSGHGALSGVFRSAPASHRP